VAWVTVSGVPDWVDADELLGPGPWARDDDGWTAQLEREAAADVGARLRGLGMGGGALEVVVRPSLKRKHVRDARTREARNRRDTSPGFTRRGVRLDEEGRRSLTPERLALDLGRAAQRAGIRTVLDAFAGAGGNAIGFARAGVAVTATELDPDRAADARHNVDVYDVADRVQVRAADALQVMGSQEADLLFLDPPWGGYDHVRTGVDDVPLLRAALAFAPRFPHVWCKLPPSFDPHELPGFRPRAVFGHQPGDRHRVKFVWLQRP